MASIAASMIGSYGTTTTSPLAGKGTLRARRHGRPSAAADVRCAYGSTVSSVSDWSLRDQYRTLRIHPGASESDVKKAFRKLALQYHPDVCKGSNCGVQFHRINEAYDMVMNSFREPEDADAFCADEGTASSRRYVHDDYTWDLWEEWMGFEGGCTASYTRHINPYL